MRDCIHEEIESARNHERSEQDLDAQQAMAWFTKLIGITGILGLGIGAVSIFGIFFIWKEMSQTNRIMLEQNRPWVALERKVGCDFIADEHRVHLTWRNRLLNIGGGPAFSVKTHFKIVSAPEFQFRASLSEFIENTIKKAKSTPTLVSIFPFETDEFGKSESFSKVEPNEQYYAFHAVSYRLWHGPKAELGFDIRVYQIVENDGSVANVTNSHLLLEYRNERQAT